MHLYVVMHLYEAVVSLVCASSSAASSSAFQPTVSSMAPKAKSKNYSTKQQRITLVNSSSSSSSSGKSTSSVEITCVFIPIIQTEWQRSIWHPPLVWPPPGFDDDGEDMGMCGCWFYHETRLHTSVSVRSERRLRSQWEEDAFQLLVYALVHASVQK